MNNEEKILTILEKQSELLEKLSTRMENLEAGQASLDKRMLRLETTTEGLQEGLDRVNLRLDLEVGKRLDALAEGQAIIEKRMDTMEGSLEDVKALAEETRDKVDVIHAVVSQHSASITELKKVQ